MELCPKCKLATYISRTYTQVEGDESSDTPTKVYTVVEQSCRNPRCEQCGKVVSSERQLIYSAAGAQPAPHIAPESPAE